MAAYSLQDPYSRGYNFKRASSRSRSVVRGLRTRDSGDKELLSVKQMRLLNFLTFLNTYRGGKIREKDFEEKLGEVYSRIDSADNKMTKEKIRDIVIEKRVTENNEKYFKIHFFTISITKQLINLFSVSKAVKQELREKIIPESFEETYNNTPLALLTMGLISFAIGGRMYMNTGSGIKKQKRRRTNKNVRVKNKQKRRRNKSQKKRLSRKKRLSHKKRLSRKKR